MEKQQTASLKDMGSGFGCGPDGPSHGQREQAHVRQQHVRSENQPLFAKGQEVLKLTRSIIDAHHKSQNKIANLRTQHQAQQQQFRSRYADDKEMFREILRLGREEGERLVMQQISVGSAIREIEMTSLKKLRGGKLNDNEAVALDFFRDLPASGPGEQSWGETARVQVQAWADLMKLVPEEIAAKVARSSPEF